MSAGDLANDAAVVFGVLVFPNRAPSSRGADDVVNLARHEIREAAGGLPAVGSGGKKRPVVFVSCSGDADAAADHLVNKVKVPAMIGPIRSSEVLSVANKFTIPEKVLMLSPGGSSELVANAPGRAQLLYRYDVTTPTVTSANAALIQDYVEGVIRRRKSLAPTAKIKLGVLYSEDALGLATSSLLHDRVRFNGLSAAENGDYYLPRSYGDPSDKATFPTKYAAAVTFMASKRPDILLVDGGANLTAVLPALLREERNDPQFRPFYILPAGADNPDVAKLFNTEDLRTRAVADIQGPSVNDQNFKLFLRRFESLPSYSSGEAIPNSVSAGTYDAAYMLHYAAAALGNQPLNGENLGAAMQRLSPPAETVLPLGVLGVSQAFATLGTGGRVDFQGYRGPQDFDAKGDTVIDIVFQCYRAPSSPEGAVIVAETGLLFPVVTQRLTGTNTCFN